MSISATLAWRYLKGRPMRTVLTTLAVVFGVAVIFGLNSMLPTISETFTRSMLATAGQVDLTVSSTSGSTFEADVADRMRRIEGIKAVSPALRRPVAMPRGGPVSTLTAVGIEPQSAVKVRSFPVEGGRMLAPSDRGDIVIAASLAKRLGLRVGSHLSLPTVNGTEAFRIVGLLDIVSVPGADEVFMTLPDAQSLFAEGTRISEIDAALANGTDRALVEQRARRALGEDFAVGGIQSGSELLASLQVGQFAMNMFGVFALAMGGFIILNTFRTAVAERRHDIGMLRAIGASRRTVLGIFLIESLLQGVIGTIIGLAVGFVLAWGIVAAINPLYSQFLNMTIDSPKFETSALYLAIGLGVGITVLAALAPAIKASRITPLDALRPQLGEVEERERGRRAWIGVGVLVASGLALMTRNSGVVGLGSVGVLVGLILVAPELVRPISNLFARLFDLIFRTEGEIARSNMQRQPSRAATTAAAVMISLSIIIALLGVISSIFTGFLNYVDKSVSGADFVVLPANFLLGGGNVGASNEFVNEVRGIPGIGSVATLRIAKGSVNGSQVQVIGIDPNDYPKVASFEFSYGGTDADVRRLAQGRMLIANGIYAAQQGLKPGDRLRLTTPNGDKTYTLATVGSDYLNAKLATVYVSQERLKEDFGTEANVAVLASLRSGADAAAVKRDFERHISDFPHLALYDTTTFLEMQKTTLNSSLVMMYSLIAILAIPSLLALLNNLAMSVIARTREIGMLRAVGSTRAQIRRMVLAEALLLASVGVVFGIASGIVLGYAMVLAMNQIGFKMPYQFPVGGIITGIVIGFGFAIVAAIIPARSAAKLDIVEALHYE